MQSVLLVVFVPARSQDVVPGCGLVTLKTLVDTGVRLTSITRRNHLEVHHVVAWWCLMALGVSTPTSARFASWPIVSDCIVLLP